MRYDRCFLFLIVILGSVSAVSFNFGSKNGIKAFARKIEEPETSNRRDETNLEKLRSQLDTVRQERDDLLRKLRQFEAVNDENEKLKEALADAMSDLLEETTEKRDILRELVQVREEYLKKLDEYKEEQVDHLKTLDEYKKEQVDHLKTLDEYYEEQVDHLKTLDKYYDLREHTSQLQEAYNELLQKGDQSCKNVQRDT